MLFLITNSDVFVGPIHAIIDLIAKLSIWSATFSVFAAEEILGAEMVVASWRFVRVVSTIIVEIAIEMDWDASVVQALEFIWLALILSLTKLRILIQTLITTIIYTVTNPCLKKREKREFTSFVEPVRFLWYFIWRLWSGLFEGLLYLIKFWKFLHSS